jgi:hypothetical protein
MAVRIEKIVATVLDEAHRRQPRRRWRPSRRNRRSSINL